MHWRIKQLYWLALLLLWLVTVLPAGAAPLPNPIYIASVAWSPDGSMIAVGKGTPTCEPDASHIYDIQILDAETQHQLKTLVGAKCAVTAIDWRPDGTKLVASSLDYSFGLRVWDVESGQLLSTVQRGGQGVSSVRWRPDGSQLIAGTVSNGIAMVDPTSGEVVGSPPIGGTDLDWSPDGSQLVSGSIYENLVYVADMVMGQQTMVLAGHTGPLGTVDWSPDSSRLASAAADNTLRIWDAASGDLLLTIETGHVTQVRWSPDSQKIAAASISEVAQVWDANSGELLNTFSYTGRVHSVDWSPNGTQLVYGGYGADGLAAQIEIRTIAIE